ncbi:hypothetical protein Fcan01_19092 [Folsomia candida]|uniref:Uncharacterized protein n=1 Tax=Folsomia candida TaxID=158441 RepID=A0A226DM80_FOLCA|nr:hypothetical protein Fcan01_19092 [Folsomia candida]
MLRNGYMFHIERGKRHNRLWDKAILIVVTTQTEQQILTEVYIHPNGRNKIGVLFLLGGDKFKICYWHRDDWDEISINEHYYLIKVLYCGIETGQLTQSVFKSIRDIEPPMQSWCYGSEALAGGRLDIRDKLSNPFELNLSSPKIIQHMLQVVFSKANRTLIFKHKCYAAKRSLRFVFISDNDIRVGIAAFETFITIDFIGYQYLTCNREEYITLRIYISPFKPWLWFVLLTSVTLIIVITSTYKYLTALRNTSFAPWLFILATMFEESGFLPKKIDRKWFLRLILGTWCLASVILTNCYNGIMISELNAPLAALRLSTFEQLLCHRADKNDIPKFEAAY